MVRLRLCNIPVEIESKVAHFRAVQTPEGYKSVSTFWNSLCSTKVTPPVRVLSDPYINSKFSKIQFFEASTHTEMKRRDDDQDVRFECDRR